MSYGGRMKFPNGRITKIDPGTLELDIEYSLEEVRRYYFGRLRWRWHLGHWLLKMGFRLMRARVTFGETEEKQP